MKIAAWGNSLALRLPRSVVEASKLRIGMHVSVRNLDNGAILITPSDRFVVVMEAKTAPKVPRLESDW